MDVRSICRSRLFRSHVHAHDLRKATIMLSRPAPETFHIDVWRSFAPYVWQLLDEVRGEFAEGASSISAGK